MPLENTTRRYDLREEADRLDDELDDLAAQSVDLQEQFADLQGRAATADDEELDDDDLQNKIGRLTEDYEELKAEIDRANREYNGLVWALDRYGAGVDEDEHVMADGGEPRPSEESDSSDPPEESVEDALDDAGVDKQELYEQMTGDEGAEGATDAAGGRGEQPPTAADDASPPAAPTQSADSPAPTGDQHATQPAQADARAPGSNAGGAGATNTSGTTDDTADTVTITLGGLTAGEHARVTDRAGDAQAERSRSVVGQGQQSGSVEGASRVFYCAAGLVDAPFVERGADFETTCEAVREIHPGLMAWIESRIDDVNTPSENLGKGWQDRVSHAQTNRSQTTETSPPDTNT